MRRQQTRRRDRVKDALTSLSVDINKVVKVAEVGHGGLRKVVFIKEVRVGVDNGIELCQDGGVKDNNRLQVQLICDPQLNRDPTLGPAPLQLPSGSVILTHVGFYQSPVILFHLHH